MKSHNRQLARLGAGAVGLFVAGSFASPAYAVDGTDLSVELSGTTIAAGSTEKVVEIDLENVGKTTPESVDIIFTVGDLVGAFQFADICDDDPADGTVYCAVDKTSIPEPGGTTDLSYLVTRADDSADASGELTVTVLVDGDDNTANNTDTAEVVIGEHGVDLGVVAEDVRAPIDADASLESGAPVYIDGSIAPGGSTAVVATVFNQGDMTADGVRISVTLPEQATFTEPEQGCEYSADNRTVTCDYSEITLIPADHDTQDGDATSGGTFWFPAKIDAGVAKSGALTGGSVTVAALAAVPYGPKQNVAAPTALPENVELLDAADVDKVVDVDESDNTDTYSIFVSVNGGSGGGSTGGDGSSLPVTGAQAGLFGGLGAFVIVLGAALFLIARRRRVVLMTPGDEKPNA
ncbi:LPXTG cell wall anchor domain-containing protein [Salinispora pacifica]|uniref:LPXTG cell wall anchor domain-containing protein n=1 Tax=Salinispora pacifica TaxID=351187 RepID=UPI000364ECC4|nr:LPXTG cell wall anchor domain-containing protein [Salinispora pacifica]